MKRRDVEPRTGAHGGRPSSRRLLRAALPASLRAEVLDDLDERYEARARVDARTARRWYTRQVGWLALWGMTECVRQALGVGPEPSRRLGSGSWMDVRLSFRALVRNPGYATVAIVTLALGIGGNTAIYSIIDAAYIDALAYPDDEQLVVPYNVPAPEQGGGFAAFSSLRIRTD